MLFIRLVIVFVCILSGCGQTQKKNTPPEGETVATIKDGETLLAQHEFKKAAVLFGHLLGEQPKNAEAHYYFGLANKQLGELSVAEKHYRLALEYDQDLLPAHNNLGLLLLERGDLEQAEAELRIYVTKRQDDPAAHFNYGLVLEEMGRIEKAESHYKIAAEQDPKDPYPWIGMGDLARYKKEFETALDYYNKASEWAPELPELLIKKGQTLLDLGQTREAIDVLAPLASSRRADPDMITIAGILLANARQEDRAIQFYRAALSKDRDYARAHLLLANALARKAHYAEAAGHYRSFLSLSEETAQTPEIRKRLEICESKMK
jgi:tetratricopeptide (TPR) repeat protein